MYFSHIGELAALVTAVCWTFTSLAFESAGKRIGSLAVNIFRLMFASIFLALFCWIDRGLPLPLDASRHNLLWLGLSGLVGFTFGDLCLLKAFVVIGSRLSLLLMALVPPITALIGWLSIGEILSIQDCIGMAFAVGGVAWVLMERSDNGGGAASRVSLQGILLGLGGALGQAAGLVLSKYAMQGYDAFAATQIRIYAGLAGFAILFVFIGWWPKVFAAAKDVGAVLQTSLGALAGSFLGVSLSLVAVKHTQTGVAATIMALVPVLIIPVTVLVKKEPVSTRAVIGACVSVCGAALLFW